MKKKLLIILGAGSSVSCEMPSVRELDERVREWGREWVGTLGFPNYFEELWKTIEAYYGSGKSTLRPAINYEKALGEMIALSHWMEPAPWGNTLRQTASEGAAPPHLTFPQGDYGATTTVNDQLTHLLIQLAKHMRERCLELDRSTNTFARYLQLMNGLQGKFEIGVYNLNYDTLALSARSGAFTGFASSGKFNANAVLQRQEWNFVYHLHGSVHYSLNHSFGDQIEWRDLAGEFVYGHRGLSTDERSDGKSLPKTALIAGGFKLDQLLVEPFHTHHAALARHIYEADAILIGACEGALLAAEQFTLQQFVGKRAAILDDE